MSCLHLSAITALSTVTLWFAVSAQSVAVNITGSVVDNGTSAVLANAKVKLLEFPSCTTRTDANGNFILSTSATVTQPHSMRPVSPAIIILTGNRLSISVGQQPVRVIVDVFTVLGQRVYHAEKAVNGSFEVPSLWKSSGLYFVKVKAGDQQCILSSIGSQQTAVWQAAVNHETKGMAKISAIYTIEAGKAGYDSKQVSMNAVTGNAGIIRLSPYAQAPGTWIKTTPKYLDSAFAAGGSWGGVQSILVDPVRPSDIYANADCQGTWKSTDYGLTWVKVNTGVNGNSAGNGRQWCAAIVPDPNRDPATPPAIMTVLGYGSGGIWKSANGGVDWVNLWNNNAYAPDGITNISGDVGNDVSGFMFLDSVGSNHMISHLHSYWGTGGNNGIFETTNGGTTWFVHKAQTFDFQPHSDGAAVLDAKTWLVFHGAAWPTKDIYRTTDGGESWNVAAQGLNINGGGMWIGSTYCATGTPLFKTLDKGQTWKQVPSAGIVGWMCTTKTNHIYVIPAEIKNDVRTLRHAEIGNDSTWVNDAGPNFTDSPRMITATFDGTHAIIFGAAWKSGILRYVEP